MKVISFIHIEFLSASVKEGTGTAGANAVFPLLLPLLLHHLITSNGMICSTESFVPDCEVISLVVVSAGKLETRRRWKARESLFKNLHSTWCWEGEDVTFL